MDALLLSNDDLKYLCPKLGIKLNGVMFKQGFKDITILKDGAYIINLDRTESKGTHWVCCYKKGKIIMYFDSFGENCFEELKEVAKKNKCSIIESMFQLQNLNDNSCGFYCLGFLHWIHNKKLNSRNLNIFNEMFKTDHTQSNKDILSKYLRKAILRLNNTI